VRYPPLGKRGIGGSIRATNYGREHAYYQRANSDVALLLLVESEEGVANLDEILAVPGIDGIYFGPGDFASDAQIQAGQTSENVMQIMSDCLKRVRSAGLIAGIQAREPQITRYSQDGANLIGIGVDLQLLASAADQLAGRWCGPAKVCA
jgi:4-hydroxy-2-oxoheptanedioate aldolase